MNKSYRSIWNPSLGCYVAAPECATAHPTGTSSSRAVRSGCPMRSRSALVLEPRVLFDGAMLVTAIETDSAEAPAAESVDEGDAAEAPASEPSVAATGDTPDANVTKEATEEATGDTTEDTAQDASADLATTADDDTDVATAPEEAARTEVVFVDGRVSDPGAFATDGREVVVLSTEQDGMTQIADALAGRTDIDAIHIVSHGGDGYLSLGSGSITAETIQSTNLSSLQQIGLALAEDGDILIYACDYAAGDAGLASMALIADITGADVAASTDATGHESLGGDWALEQSMGEIETTALAPVAWMNALDFTFTGAGSVGAMGMAENIMGAGVTVVSATYQGGANQSGTFTSGSGVTFGSDILGFGSGTILSTGSHAGGVAGPNTAADYGDDVVGAVDGDTALNAMAGNATFDAAILNIDFIPDVPPGGNVGDVGRMTLEIVFGSEEYLEYVGQINDVMEVTVNGQVVSLVPNSSGGESTIGINSVNTTQNQSLFISNTGGTYNTQMDAFTITIPMVFDVIVGQTNSIRLAVADAYDAFLDSWLFVRADSGQTVVVAENDSVTTATNQPITVDLTANDYSLAGGAMTLTHIQGQAVTQGQEITLDSGIRLTVGSGGQVTVTGNGLTSASDTFTYQVSNGLGGVASATVHVDVTPLNLTPPTAQNDAEAVLADATLSDSVLTNNGSGADSDLFGDPLSVVQVNLTGYTPGAPIELSSGALLTMNANGTYVYDPNGAFDGLADGATTTDSFTYTVTDGQGGNDTATVTITVTGVFSNHAPVAVDDGYVASEEGAVVLGNPKSNDSDADGDELELVYASTTGSNGGSIGTDDSGNLVFIAGSSFDDLAVGQTRDTTFTYTLSDGLGATDTATITVTVQGANDAPNAQDDHYDVSEDGGHTLGSVRANDSDIDSSEIWTSFNATEGTNGGMFSQDDSGNLIFVPGSAFDSLAVGETRDTSFSYVLEDSDGGQSAATVTVTVHGVNDAPVAEADQFVASEDAASSFGRVSVNDWDVDGTELWVDTSATGAGDQGGFFSFDDSGSLIFNPGTDFDDLAAGESRDTQFVYTLYDDQGTSSTGTVTVTVLGANDNPVAQNDSFLAYEDSALSLGSLAGNDSDVDGDGLQVVLPGTVEGSTGGRFWLDDAGSLIFDPEGDFDDLATGDTRETSFTYTVADGLGGSSEATVTVAVHGVDSGEGDPVVTPPGDGETGGGEPSPSYPNQIVFVDARVPDPQAFALDGRELVILSSDTDGLVQIASALDGRSGIEAIHVVSHGSEGTVTLGLGDIDAGNVQAEQIAALQTIAQSLTVEGDILVYACEFAGGEAGLNAMLLLSQYTQADVAASLFVTGSPLLGGNWSLEATVGSVEADAIAPQNWNHLLDVPQDMPVAQTSASPVAQPVLQVQAPVTPVVAVWPTVAPQAPAHVAATVSLAQEPALLAPHTTRVHELETAMRSSLQAVQPEVATEAGPAGPAMVGLHSEVQDTGVAAGAMPVWQVERQEIWTASQPLLDELALEDGEADADQADEPAHAAPGFRAQLSRFAQWGTGRPLTRATAHA